ncbi:MAG: S-adenosyl-l-methionine hydroxide adenosyltransferase family protein [Ferruginibacter sp.]
MKYLFILAAFLYNSAIVNAQNGIVVFQTDFGLKDGAVSAMKGVAMNVDRKLQLFDLTHEIPAYNIWEAALRLEQAAAYWPKGTVFVSVVDPGVGSQRKSVVLQTSNDYFFVTPDNGTLTFIAQSMGIKALRQIDEKINRLPGSAQSYTFHGRDVYAYTAARLASRKISFEQVGPLLPSKVETIPHQQAVLENGIIKGNIPILDIQYGNVWTNIGSNLLTRAGIQPGDSVRVSIYKNSEKLYEGTVLYAATFSAVAEGKPVCYLNSLLQFSIALNMGNFAEQYKVGSGPEYSLQVRKE